MPRPRKLADAELVAAAARAIGRRGPFALTLADVASEAGVSPATLVGRFGSKRGLLLAVAAAGAGGVGRTFGAARERHDSPAHALERALGDLAATVTDPDEVANHLAFLALDLTDPEFRAHAAAHTGALRREIESSLGEAIAAGELLARARRPLATALPAAYHGTLLTWAIEREGSATDRVREAVRGLLRPYRT